MELRSDGFRIVGADYKQHVQEIKKQSFWQWIQGKPVASILLLVIIAGGCMFAKQLYNHDPSDFYLQHLNEAPGKEFYFGTDSLGRDIYSMIWAGGRFSVLIGLISAFVITVLGVTYGCVSGMCSSNIDSIMMRMAELLNSIPSLLLLLLLVSAGGKQNVVKMSLVIGVTGWFGLARIVRNEVRQIRSSDYVLAARCMGSSFRHIMNKHLIPNFVSAIMFVVVSAVSTSMSMESTLSFLGLGLPVEVVSWGSMLSLANKALLLNTWWVIIIPGLFLITTLICITNIGNYFRKEINRKPNNL